MMYGYCRCSTLEKLGLQDIDRQIRELEKLGVKKENIFSEYESGAKVERIQLNKLLEIVNTWNVDISNTMKKVVELSDDDLVIFENEQLIINNCYDSKYEDNIYRKLAGYYLNENYISMKTNKFLNSFNNIDKTTKNVNERIELKRVVYQEEYVVKKHNNKDYF